MGKVWQVSGGTADRDFSKSILFKFGIATIGPGWFGDFNESEGKYEGKCGKREQSVLKRFCTEINENDIIILKEGNQSGGTIKAVGQIKAEKYEFIDIFQRVDGWSLGHCYHVKWKRPSENVKIKRGILQERFGEATNEELIYKAKEIWENGTLVESNAPIPKMAKKLESEEVIATLVQDGYIDDEKGKILKEKIDGIIKMGTWYEEQWHILEAEVKTFLIIPLLLALGWNPQQIKLELKQRDSLKKKDLAVFIEDYDLEGSANKDPVFIVEAKRLEKGLVQAEEQVGEYAKKFKTLEYFVTSNGINYYLYKMMEDEPKLYAVLDILELTERYKFDKEVGGAEMFFEALINRNNM